MLMWVLNLRSHFCLTRQLGRSFLLVSLGRRASKLHFNMSEVRHPPCRWCDFSCLFTLPHHWIPNPVENVCNIVKQGPHLKSSYRSPNQGKKKKNRIGNRQSKFQTTSHTHTHTHTHSAQMSNFHMSLHLSRTKMQHLGSIKVSTF
jgi:hypothetical protein